MRALQPIFTFCLAFCLASRRALSHSGAPLVAGAPRRWRDDLRMAEFCGGDAAQVLRCASPNRFGRPYRDISLAQNGAGWLPQSSRSSGHLS